MEHVVCISDKNGIEMQVKLTNNSEGAFSIGLSGQSDKLVKTNDDIDSSDSSNGDLNI